MTISWKGFNYFKLQDSNRTIVLNPYSLDKSTKFSKFKSDIILFSNPSQVKKVKFNKEAFTIFSAGEYETNNIFIYGREINKNIVYLIIYDGVKIAFLGEFNNQELEDKDLELIEGADVLILPVGGGDLTTPKEANKIVRQVEPRIVIPSCHSAGSFKLKAENINNFVKEFGTKAEIESKFKIQKKNLPQDEMKLIILKI